MPINLYLAPAAGGKTTFVIEQARRAAQNLAEPVQIVVPSGLQAQAVKQRLAQAGGALGVRVQLFHELYQQALDARYKHLDTLRDIQQVYERLVSQLTNISLSLESMYSRMVKLKTSEYSLASAESDQVSAQLHGILEEMDQLDSAINENLSLPD